MKFEFVINLKTAKADRRDDSAECAGAGGSGDSVDVEGKPCGKRLRLLSR